MAAKLSYRCFASANLPVYSCPDMRIMVFGMEGREAEIVALVHKAPNCDPRDALVRMHSACITGDVLGSMKCDCGAQLRIALDAIARTDHGVVLYLLNHEGRGIGLVNKIRAYALQDQGLDTVEANTALGFKPDEREFDGAAAVLLELGIRRVRLLTNNPDKASGLERCGVEVVARVPMDVPSTEYNRDYLDVKRRIFGHLPVRDPLTECCTNEAFAEIFEARFAGLVPGKAQLSMLGIVVVPYREIKARHGERAADRLMGSAASALRACMRKEEMFVQVAEDRFVVVLVGAGPEIARKVAARIEDGVARATFHWEGTAIPWQIRTLIAELKAMPDSAAVLDQATRIARAL